jgi:hypothetical protein
MKNLRLEGLGFAENIFSIKNYFFDYVSFNMLKKYNTHNSINPTLP